MSHTVQIPESLFCALCEYHIYGATQYSEYIKRGLDTKLDALLRRDLYSRYLAGDETARRDYLDLKGVPEEYRW